MKRIVLGISILLMLVQNGFANKKTKIASYDKYKNQKALYKLLECEAEVEYYKTNSANPNICIEAANSIYKGEDLGFLSKDKKKYLGESYFNAGIIYQWSRKNHKKALEVYIKAYNAGYCDYDNCSIGRNIGYYYATGTGGVKSDKIMELKLENSRLVGILSTHTKVFPQFTNVLLSEI